MAKLKEQDFIHEGYQKDPRPLWIFVALVLLTGGAYALMQNWQGSYVEEYREQSALLRVTNRDFASFLWQNPEWMRNNVRKRTGYLPGFDSSDRIGIKQGMAEELVVAPPEILYRYHVWKRLLGGIYFERPITRADFSAFVEDQPEWLPQAWPDAPASYAELVQEGDGSMNIAGKLPLAARIAFQGWRNFFQEGESINRVQPAAEELDLFLSDYPVYRRSLWKNIFAEEGIHYLATPSDLAPFLRTAIYNWRLASE